jgi:hypothetical protein
VNCGDHSDWWTVRTGWPSCKFFSSMNSRSLKICVKSAMLRFLMSFLFTNVVTFAWLELRNWWAHISGVACSLIWLKIYVKKSVLFRFLILCFYHLITVLVNVVYWWLTIQAGGKWALGCLTEHYWSFFIATLDLLVLLFKYCMFAARCVYGWCRRMSLTHKGNFQFSLICDRPVAG